MAAAKPGVTKKTPPRPGQQAAAKPAVRKADFRIETVSRRQRYLKLLIYGNYGVGKTTLACSALEVNSMNDVLLVNAEAGDLSVDDFEGLDEVTVTTFRQFGRIHEFLKQHCKARDEGDIEKLKSMERLLKGLPEDFDIPEPRQYRTVIIDSLTEVEAMVFNQLLGITDSTRLDEEVQGAEWSEYKKNNGMILRIIRAFRDLPMHVVFTCAEQFTQDETKKQKYSPDMTGKLTKKVQAAMDMVGYYAMGKEGDKQVRRLYVSPPASGRFDAKHRYSTFKGEFFQDPSLGSILTEVGLNDPEGTKLK